MPASDVQGWNAYYTDGRAAWDNGAPSPEILELVAQNLAPQSRILEIGCGTGKNAVALAAQSHLVTALDIAPAAIEAAKSSAAAEKIPVDFRLADFFTATLPAHFHAAIDRGTFHLFHGDDALRFADRVADILLENGIWITICISCDDPTPGGKSPKLSLTEFTASVEPRFEILRINTCPFPLTWNHSLLAWACLLRKRPTKAPQTAPSSPSH